MSFKMLFDMYKHICSRLMQNVYYDDVQKLLRQKYKKKTIKVNTVFAIIHKYMNET